MLVILKKQFCKALEFCGENANDYVYPRGVLIVYFLSTHRHLLSQILLGRLLLWVRL